MMVLNQDHPFRSWLAVPGTSPRSAIHDFGPCLCFAEGVGACIDGVCENGLDGLIQRQPPDCVGLAGLRDGRRKADVLLSKPYQNLAHTPQLPHLFEHQRDRLLNTLIRALLDFAVQCPAEPDWNWNPQLTTAFW